MLYTKHMLFFPWYLINGTTFVKYSLTYLLTYLLNQWSRVLLEKLTGFLLGKKFPAFYGTRRFITAFTSARQCQLDPVHTPKQHKIHLNIMLPSTCGSFLLFPSGFPHQNLVYASLLPICASCQAQFFSIL